MAKGNLLLGSAARSIGDVVMYRREGSQVSRVRVRQIGNPKTTAQCKQRAIMSAVVKFYQPLATVLERSWQGLSTSKSYAKFLQYNVKLAKKNNWYLPKSTGFFPLKLRLSHGLLPSIDCDINPNYCSFNVGVLDDSTEHITTIGQLSQMFVNGGFKNGDVVTIIIALRDTNDKYSPYTIQFAVDTTSTALLTSISGFFTIDLSSAGDGEVKLTQTIGENRGMGVIVSRDENGTWKRNTCVFKTYFPDEEEIYPWTDEKIAAAIASYGNEAGSVNPMVYLDGDELDNA